MSIRSMRVHLGPQPLLALLGLASLLPYIYLLRFESLREHTLAFEAAFFAAFALYAAAAILALRLPSASRRTLAWIFLVAALMGGLLLLKRPTLSDDMYRYVWDGRVQAQGISPYTYPPSAPELAYLRDGGIWPFINRKDAVTIYPPGAEMAYYLLWRLWPDSLRWFQFAMGMGGLVAGWLLVKLLQALGRSPARALIYLWSPLLLFETAHSAHVDGLLLPFLVGTWLVRVRERHALVGILLGIATAFKLYPVFLFPTLWQPRHPQGRYRMPLAFLATLLLAYLPYTLANGSAVVGFLPMYFRQQFNISPLVQFLLFSLGKLGANPQGYLLLLTLAVLFIIGLWIVLHPAANGEQAIRRGLWLMGAIILLSQNLFPWYLLWFLPLLAVFLRPQVLSLPSPLRLKGLPLLRPDAWTGWWVFCGLSGLSYTFFIHWKPIPVAIWAQFLPLYVLLLIAPARHFGSLIVHRWKGLDVAPPRLQDPSPAGPREPES